MRPLASLIAGLASGTVALGGCGGSSHPGPRVFVPASGAVRPGAGPELVAALGDSITAGSPMWDPDPQVRQGIGSPDPHSQFEYWAQQRLGTAVRFRNCGVFGERTDQIARRLDACATGARVLVIQGGINDIAQSRSVDLAAGDLDAMVRRGQSAGLRVELTQVLPWNNGYPQAAPLISRLNGLIDAIGQRRHVAVLGFYGALEDPRAPGRMRPDLTSDGDHPSVAGYRRLGDLVRLP